MGVGRLTGSVDVVGGQKADGHGVGVGAGDWLTGPGP